jgi:hypothetical protein
MDMPKHTQTKYTKLGNRNNHKCQWWPQPLTTMLCQNNKGGLVLRMSFKSETKGNHWPLAAVKRAMWAYTISSPLLGM